MTTFVVRRGSTASTVMPYVLLVLFLACFLIIPGAIGHPVSSVNVYNVGQTVATYGTLALGLSLLMIAGEFDISLAAVYGLGAMAAVKYGGESALLGIVIAMALAAAVGLLNGLLVTRGRLNSVPVTLGAFIAVSGAVVVISNNESVPYENFAVGLSLDDPIASVLSWRSLIGLAAFVLVGSAVRFTRWGRDLRAVGGDRRAARVAGVQVTRLVTGTFVVAAVLAAVPGALLGYSLAGASPAYGGFSSLVFAVTAVLIGGVALSGGQGTALGTLVGVLSLALLRETLTAIAAPAYASDLLTGGLLFAIAVVGAPSVMRGAKARGWVNAERVGAVGSPGARGRTTMSDPR